MTYFDTWRQAIQASLQNLWGNVVGYLPQLLGALVVLIVGLIVASLLGKLAKKIVHYTHVDKLFDKLGIAARFEHVGVNFTISGIVGWLVKWFFIIVVLIAVVDILKLQQITQFLKDVAQYIPNVVVAVFILVIGLILGQFVHQVVEKSSKAYHLTEHASDALAAISKWAIVIFALLTSLSQLNIATRLIEILFMGLVAMLAVAFGLAFGLGGKEKASRFLEHLGKK